VAACLDGDRVLLRVLSQCRLGQTVLRAGDRIVGRFNVALLAGR
jgi:hypothetical protein